MLFIQPGEGIMKPASAALFCTCTPCRQHNSSSFDSVLSSSLLLERQSRPKDAFGVNVAAPLGVNPGGNAPA
jgi:hypothetical protein